MFMKLSETQLFDKVPSVFTESSSARTSRKYKHISTIHVAKGLESHGFMPVWARECKSRLEAKRAYTKHMIRFRHESARPTASGLYPELVLTNSHDGTSSYRLNAGVFRVVCSNGLIAGNTYADVRVKHQGEIIKNVIEGTYEIIDTSRKLLQASDKMSKCILTRDEKNIFSKSVHELCFDDESPFKDSIDCKRLLVPRRSQDTSDDLFTVFNVMQENIMKGGIRGFVRNSQGYPSRTVRTREIKSINKTSKFNQDLWTIAEKMLAMKRAA